jgi:hypothetical protein
VFTHHKAPQWFTIAGVIIFLVTIEGVLIHFILQSYHYDIAKWLMSASSLSLVVWLLHDMRALSVERSRVCREHGAAKLELRIGARLHAAIPLDNIARIEIGAWDAAGPDEAIVVLFGKANVRLTFHQPHAVKPAFAGEKHVHSLLIQVDDPEAFQRALLDRSST